MICFIAMHGRAGFSRAGPPAVEEAAREKATRSIFGENSKLHTQYISNLSVFFCDFVPYLVANIAFETTEEQLRPILCEVGPVVSLK